MSSVEGDSDAQAPIPHVIRRRSRAPTALVLAGGWIIVCCIGSATEGWNKGVYADTGYDLQLDGAASRLFGFANQTDLFLL